MKKVLLGILIGFVLTASGAVFVYQRFLHPVPRPGPEASAPIIVQPSEPEKKKADVTTKIHHRITVPLDQEQGDSVRGKVFVPAAAEITVEGLKGAKTAPAEVTRTETGDLVLTTDTEIAITYPEPLQRRWEAGLAFGIDSHGEVVREAWGQYDVWQRSGRRIDLAAPVRLGWAVGEGFRLMAGVKVRF